MNIRSRSFNTRSGKAHRTLLAGLALGVLTLGVLLAWTYYKQARRPLPIYGQVPEFALTNHLGVPVSTESLRGQVWVADVIFTRCPLACPQMTKRMSDLQAALPAEARVKLVSVTTDPEFDSPPVLRKYAEKYGALPDRWWFLTGSKPQVGHALTHSLRLSAVENRPELRTNQFDLFTHSTIFVLVDKHARLRAAVESLEPDWKAKILDDINQLLGED